MARFLFSAAFLLGTLFTGNLVRANSAGGNSFSAWANFGIGSSETTESTIDSPSGKMVSTMEQKLVEKAADHLVLEVSSSMVLADGTAHAMPPNKITLQAAPDPTKDKTPIGTEDVSAAGKTFSCQIYTASNPNAAQKITVKIWACPDVPGGVVKMEMDQPAAKITSILKSLEVK